MASDHSTRSCFKKRKIEEEEYGSCSSLEALPVEIIADIFSRLPITSLVRLTFVCRSWRSLAQDPLLLNAHLSSSANPARPCLLFHCDFPIRNELHFSDLSSYGSSEEAGRSSKTKKFSLPFAAAMPEFDVVGSCNGLLCLSDSLYNDSLYVYNPFTRNCVELPETSAKYHDQELVFGFGFHPRTKDYKVVKIVYYRSNSNGNSSSSSSGYRARGRIQFKQSEVHVLTLSSRTELLSWRSLGKAPYKFVKRSSEALVNGRLHFVTRPRRHVPARKFISFDLEDEEFREIPKPDSGGLNRSNHRLVNLKGCLSAVVYGNYGKLDIWVMKSYGVKESWVKEYSVGAYLPKGLKQNLDRPMWIWKNAENGKVVRVLCVLENGEILLEYKSRVLVSYDPNKGKFKDLVLSGLPNWFHTVVHVGTLAWFDTPIDV
ncbi:PREDICTED: F-box protein At3g07870 [Tarenaya hassleriana]|uniref:F-box protein At3g07870 n=1 Tax=Tarenaya hassleriana TaxID=28532 RepID=UPI00053C1C04|nr:PREDICTED: F-box protein At3g07870 [Tarenaya hassleriana]